MSRMISALAAIAIAVLTLLPAPAFAADLANGAKVFGANCASCHLGGKNLVNPAKTLQKADLEKYEMASVEAITNQVTNGKNGMPAFKSRLTPEQIEDVANYVLDEADKGWS